MIKLPPFPFKTALTSKGDHLSPPLERWFRDLWVLLNNIDSLITTSTIDHAKLDNLNSTNIHHLTDAQYAKLHDPLTVTDSSTIDLTLTDQDLTAKTIGLTRTVVFTDGTETIHTVVIEKGLIKSWEFQNNQPDVNIQEIPSGITQLPDGITEI
jgi:hypothetical protein